jgi:hypothetical protein
MITGGGLATGKFVALKVSFHTVLYRHSVLEETRFSESEAAGYPVLLLWRDRGENDHRLKCCFCGGVSYVVRLVS